MTDTTTSDPVSVALALLDQHWPSVAALVDGPGGEALAKLESDPRYLIGRLQQALTTLLATDLPPMDPRTALLSRALDDALAWRTHHSRPCSQCGDSLCDRCGADWDLADRYHELARALGAVGDMAAFTPPDPPAEEGAEPVECDQQATEPA